MDRRASSSSIIISDIPGCFPQFALLDDLILVFGLFSKPKQ